MADRRFGELVALAEERMRELQVPGVAVGLIDGEREDRTCLGVVNVERGRRVDADSVFRIASITKTFTATALVALQERGTLDLDAPVRRYVPEFRLRDADPTARVTLRHLLAHTGGWIGEDPPDHDGPDALGRVAASCAEAQGLGAPGEFFSYNNAGYTVAGRALEAVTGLPYEAALDDLVLMPLGLRQSSFGTQTGENVAAEHTIRDGSPAIVRDDSTAVRSSFPGGGLRSTLTDLLRYARCQLGEGPQVLSVRAAASMWEKQVATGIPNSWKAISWFVDERQGVRLLHHGGATVTHMSLLAFVPERRLAVAVLTNGVNGTALTWAVARRAVELYGGARPQSEPRPIDISAAALAQYAGTYEWPTSDVRLAAAGNSLELRMTWKGYVSDRPPLPPMRLAFYAPDAVLCIDGPLAGQHGDFLRDDRGAVRFFRWNLRARPRAG